MIHRHRSLVIVADAPDVDGIKMAVEEGADIVAFSLPAKLSLEKAGISVYFPDEMIDMPDLAEIGTKNFGFTAAVCGDLDRRLAERYPIFNEFNIRPFQGSFFVMKVFMDSLASAGEILRRLADQYRGKRIRVFGGVYGGRDLFENGKSVVPSLVKEVFLKGDDDVELMEPPPAMQRKKRFTDILRRGRDVVNSMGASGKKKDGQSVFVFDNRYDVRYVIRDIFKGAHVYDTGDFQRWVEHIPGYCDENTSSVEPEGMREMFGNMSGSPAYSDTSYNNDEFKTFTYMQAERYAMETIVPLIPFLKGIRSAMHKRQPGLILTSSCRFGLKNALLFDIARSLNIPVVTYQEGGGAGYIDWPLFNLDMDLSDYFLVYGNGVVKSPFLDGRAKMVPVGSIRLETLRKPSKKRLQDKKTIYVVLDIPKLNTYQHYPYNGGFFSEIYRHQMGIISILREFAGINFKLKTVKGKEFLYEAFADGNSIKLETRPLSSVLHDADGFILDYPSTVLQECLMTDKPIALCYNACNKTNVKFDRTALHMLQRRARVSGDKGEFRDTLKLFMDDVKYGSSMVKDHEFLDSFCIMEDTRIRLDNFFQNLCPWLS